VKESDAAVPPGATVVATRKPGCITLSVRGVTPKVWGNRGIEWRSAVALKARSVPRPDDIDSSSEFRVEAVFYTLLPYGRSGDLDNLAKPVLDTLFHGSHIQGESSLAGALFDVDDGQVTDLRLRKAIVSSPKKEGVDLTIRWKVAPR
jgi:Holliday junction resolvase RusA-like endonuclease